MFKMMLLLYLQVEQWINFLDVYYLLAQELLHMNLRKMENIEVTHLFLSNMISVYISL